MAKHRPWRVEDDLELLKYLDANIEVREISKLINRTLSAVRNQTHQLRKKIAADMFRQELLQKADTERRNAVLVSSVEIRDKNVPVAREKTSVYARTDRDQMRYELELVGISNFSPELLSALYSAIRRADEVIFYGLIAPYQT